MSTEILRQIAPDSKLAPSPASPLAGSGFGLHGVQPASTHLGDGATGGLGIFADNLSALVASPESARSVAYKRHDELRSVLRSARKPDGSARWWRYGMPGTAEPADKLPRVALCATRLIPGQEGALMRQGNKAHFSGLIRCGSAACPVCGPRKMERESLALLFLWAEADKQGFKPVMVTLTAAHHAGMSLASFHGALLKAMEKFRSHRRMRNLVARYGILPMIRRSEVLFGRNGWHSHLHLLVFGRFDFSSPDELLELNRVIDSTWASALESVGLSGLSGIRAQVTRVHSAQAAQYVAKFGKEPQQSDWNAADETIRSHAKSASGLSLNELLDVSAGSQPAGSARWLPGVDLAKSALVEYYAFMRKRRLIDGLSRMAEALGLSIADVRARVVAELARQQAEAEPAEMVMPIDALTIGLMLHTRTRARAIAIAEHGGSESDVWDMLLARRDALRSRWQSMAALKAMSGTC